MACLLNIIYLPKKSSGTYSDAISCATAFWHVGLDETSFRSSPRFRQTVAADGANMGQVQTSIHQMELGAKFSSYQWVSVLVEPGASHRLHTG
jgi:hypothetical protein